MSEVTTVSNEALRGYWHPVAFSREVTTVPRRARLLDERLVLFRSESGKVACFRDLCVHRGTPLSLGWVEGETIVCAYHGWTYAAEDGRCVRIPSVDEARSIPAKARVTAYAVSERYGLVWVCLEGPRAAIAAFPEKSNTVAAQDRAIVEEQRPEELPVDLAAEMHMRGPDDPAVVYRRALAAIGIEAA